MFKYHQQLWLRGVVCFFSIGILHITITGCKPKQGATGAPGTTGTYGKFPILIRTVSVENLSGSAGTYCSFFITQPNTTNTSATCYYALQSTTTGAALGACNAFLTFMNQPLNSIVLPTTQPNCVATYKMVCSIRCWNYDGIGESFVQFTES